MVKTCPQQSPRLGMAYGPGVQEWREQSHVDVDGYEGGTPDRLLLLGPGEPTGAIGMSEPPGERSSMDFLNSAILEMSVGGPEMSHPGSASMLLVSPPSMTSLVHATMRLTSACCRSPYSTGRDARPNKGTTTDSRWIRLLVTQTRKAWWSSSLAYYTSTLVAVVYCTVATSL